MTTILRSSMKVPSLMSAIVLTLSLLIGSSHAGPDNVVVRWNWAVQQLVRDLAIPNQQSSRFFALVHGAQYESILGARLLNTNSTAAAHFLNTTTTPNIRDDVAAAYAAHYILSASFPVQQPGFDAVLKAQLANVSTGDRTLARKLGQKVAVLLLKSRIDDGSQVWAENFTFAPNGTIGKYQAVLSQTVALYPQLATTKTVIINNTAQYYQAGPKLVGSPEYNIQLSKVTAVGNSTSANRTQYQTETAWFWADLAGTHAITGHWYNITWTVLPNTTSLLDTARLYSQLGVGAYDASIVTWQQKYSILFWRPITAIRGGDGVNAPIPSWTPLLSTPGHPEYPSGHSTTSGAFAKILANYFGTDNVTFTIGSEFTSAALNITSLAPRTFTSFTAAATDVDDSREFGGVHFRQALVDGEKIGRAVGDAVYRALPKEFVYGYGPWHHQGGKPRGKPRGN